MAALPPFRPLSLFFPSLAHSTLRLLHAVDSDIHGRAGGQAKARKVWRGIASSDIGSKCGLVRRRYDQIALSLQNSSSLQSFSVHVHSPQRPSLLPSLVLEMVDVARFSLLRPHPRTHARMREALEGTSEGGAERERGRAEADGRTNGRTDEDSATVSSGRISIRNARAHLFVVFSYLIAGAGLLWAKLRMLATFGKA